MKVVFNKNITLTLVAETVLEAYAINLLNLHDEPTHLITDCSILLEDKE